MSDHRTFAAALAALASLSLTLASLGCESDTPTPSGAAPPGAPAGQTGAAACAADETLAQIATAASCQPAPGDYAPRTAGSADDMWPACISDRNEYVPFSPNISSLARVGAFEQISRLLGFGMGKAPSPDAFTEARVIYTQEQGIESRVSRREDEHYPAAAKLCRDMTPDEQTANADRCVGPVKIRPILNAAFQEGMAGTNPALNAARIEGALLWFLYISIHKEATTSADNPPDTDSMWAKYTGGEGPGGGVGLSRYVRARSLDAHHRIWDGLLAVRCWRDLDNPTGKAMDLPMRDRARAQLDRALLRGMALIVRQRAESLPCQTSWETVRILGRMLEREATARDAEAAAVLKRETAREDAATVDARALVAAIDRLFPCP